jgi:hypothetical protein
VSKGELGGVGVDVEAEEARGQPLADHLATWQQHLARKGTTKKQIRQLVYRAKRTFEGAKLRTLMDLQTKGAADKVADYLASLQEGQKSFPLLLGKELYTGKEAAALLGMKSISFCAAVKRMELPAQGLGRGRRFPRATVHTGTDAKTAQGWPGTPTFA